MAKIGKRLKKRFMNDAFCLPKGLLGQVGGSLMSLDRRLSVWVFELLEIKSDDSVLEIACGPGVGIELLSSLATEGRIAAIDPSDTMLGMAGKRNREKIAKGLINLFKASADNLPFEDDTFDVAFTINSLHLWRDPLAGLREVRRTLRTGGRFGVAVTKFSYASTDNYDKYLKQAGFRDILSHRHKGNGICFTGIKA